MKNKFLLPLLLLLVVLEAKAQDKDTYFITSNNDTIPQKDGVDYLIQLFKINRSQEKIENKKVNFSFSRLMPEMQAKECWFHPSTPLFCWATNPIPTIPRFISFLILLLKTNTAWSFIPRFGSRKTAGILLANILR